MRWSQILFSQGFGSRRECEALLRAGLVRHDGTPIEDGAAEVDPDGLRFEVEGRPWLFHERAVVMLHKPPGYECSQKPGAWPSVLTLLPAPLRRRGVQPVGRLDQDTTGLLLLTDDGALLHRLTHPKHHLPKVYEVATAEPVTAEQVARLADGVVLRDDPLPVRAAACVATGERSLRLTLTEGKYHQVKRMVAAAGNHVERLHRSAFGGLSLPDDLPPGAWRWVDRAGLDAARPA
ncbi:MAG TPA: 16S rRNA pseudouridine(516) synthase [Methylibium sp.]|nr:16S rRNA pseudouridine(516) synthase [Methylibium sp.]